ncbi:AraC family transcriptional regulator [Chryseobacterium hispalense]|uniref:AraC family transcriptional regulator n=1 Tax=Chryseobacterium hispalense TaxID=1453492 RepID=UPI000492EFD8|nr:AraC family transcriptional regulator [Chryseobacterium hispalense]
MTNNNVQLIMLSNENYDLMISPMSMSYIPSESDPDTSVAHRHDYNSLFILEKGSITMLVDNEYVTMNESSVLLINKGQVHQPVDTFGIKGWVMVFDGKILDPEILNLLEGAPDGICCFSLNHAELAFLNDILYNINITAGKTGEGPFTNKLLHGMVNTVYYKLVNIYWSLTTNTLDSSNSRPTQITHNFKRLVRKHFREEKKPASYAEKLNISVTYLNDTVKKITGFKSTNFIQQEITAEAQRQLLYTSKSVKEIAYDLGFADWKYFIRLFSKIVGKSPTVYRKEVKQV